MIIIKGTGVFGGIAFGKLAFYKRMENVVKRRKINDVSAEINRFEKAKEMAILQLRDLYDKAFDEAGEAQAQIFEAHQMMLDDGDYCESIVNIVTTRQANAEYAVALTAGNFSKIFLEMEDAYMRERAADVRDISKRLINALAGGNQQGMHFVEPVILAADDLTPSETVQLDKEKILSFVTMGGSINSHTAILSRMMNIPAVVGAGDSLRAEYDGKEAIVDGFAGTVYVEPDANTIGRLRKKANDDAKKKNLLDRLRGQENITLDGKKIDVFANIGSVTDVAIALEHDAGGIGLFRSEFLYLQKKDYPGEEEQYKAYKLVAENMRGRKVIIRTLDIGADKQIDYFNLPIEENPALGYRAIRICLDRTYVFKTQLRAIYRASAFGNIAVMFPMIISMDEIKEIKDIVQTVKSELDADGIAYSKEVETGIMIETPAAVMISDMLAKEVDFFSVGTNDLTQYTLAIDRQNRKLDRFYDSHHPAVLRMLKTVADNAHKEGKWVGICGELGADLALTEFFLAIGIDELSVSPAYVLPLREKIRGIDLSANK